MSLREKTEFPFFVFPYFRVLPQCVRFLYQVDSEIEPRGRDSETFGSSHTKRVATQSFLRCIIPVHPSTCDWGATFCGILETGPRPRETCKCWGSIYTSDGLDPGISDLAACNFYCNRYRQMFLGQLPADVSFAESQRTLRYRCEVQGRIRGFTTECFFT